MHPTHSAKPSNRVFRQIIQINALRRENYTLNEIANLLGIDAGTACLRTYGVANDNNVFQKQGMNYEYRQMHRGAQCYIDYFFLGIDDSNGTSDVLKFGSKFRKELFETTAAEERKVYNEYKTYLRKKELNKNA